MNNHRSNAKAILGRDNGGRWPLTIKCKKDGLAFSKGYQFPARIGGFDTQAGRQSYLEVKSQTISYRFSTAPRRGIANEKPFALALDLFELPAWISSTGSNMEGDDPPLAGLVAFLEDKHCTRPLIITQSPALLKGQLLKLRPKAKVNLITSANAFNALLIHGFKDAYYMSNMKRMFLGTDNQPNEITLTHFDFVYECPTK
jgi:hypothetical protein